MLGICPLTIGSQLIIIILTDSKIYRDAEILRQKLSLGHRIATVPQDEDHEKVWSLNLVLRGKSSVIFLIKKNSPPWVSQASKCPSFLFLPREIY